MSKQSLIEPQTLLFLNNALHVLKKWNLNPKYKDLDSDQMSFTERIVLHSLLYSDELSDEQEGGEVWRRLRWLLEEFKELTDFNELGAYVFFSPYLTKELLVELEEKGFFFRKKSDAFAEELKKASEFYTTYEYVYYLSYTLKPLREMERRRVEEGKEDPQDSHEYYLLSEGCIDLCLIKNKATLLPIFETFLSNYLEAFQSADTHWDENVFRWEKQHEIAQKILLEKEQYGKHFWLSLDELKEINASYGKEFRFIETLLVMQNLGELKVYFDCPNVIRGDETALSIEMLKTQNGAQTNQSIFRYGNSITNCALHYIWKDGDQEHGQKFNKNTKRRYIWEFCRKVCDQGFKTQEEMDDYVFEKLGRKEHVSTDDMKAFLSIIAQYSDVSLKELRSSYIVFKEGKGIEVKKIP